MQVRVLLDDEEEGEVADDGNDNDDEIEDDVAPAEKLIITNVNIQFINLSLPKSDPVLTADILCHIRCHVSFVYRHYTVSLLASYSTRVYCFTAIAS